MAHSENHRGPPTLDRLGLSPEFCQKIVGSDDFKIALDDRFRTMLDYLKTDEIPKQVRKGLKAAGGEG
jgi:hypothetical protein